MGSKTGLEAIEKTVIDRAVQKIYQPYFADPRPENMPILGDLMEALLAQGIRRPTGWPKRWTCM